MVSISHIGIRNSNYLKYDFFKFDENESRSLYYGSCASYPIPTSLSFYVTLTPFKILLNQMQNCNDHCL